MMVIGPIWRPHDSPPAGCPHRARRRRTPRNGRRDLGV